MRYDLRWLLFCLCILNNIIYLFSWFHDFLFPFKILQQKMVENQNEMKEDTNKIIIKIQKMNMHIIVSWVDFLYFYCILDFIKNSDVGI